MSKSRSASVLSITEATTAERLPVGIALRDLAVAPENLRFAEPADDRVPELAETIFAAGVLQPLTVRPGRRKEAPAMALDGRRRLLALHGLLAAGRIADDYSVPCFVETDVARQAAAVVLTNTAVPVHVADVIVAIGKMLGAKLTVAAISAALGYGELDIRRLAALAGLHPTALEALKAGRISLRQAKLLARLKDPAVQAEIAEAALKGFGFQDWRVNEALDVGQVTIHDRRFAFVGRSRYADAGGRLESDLFGERADVVLDVDILQSAWTARAEILAQALADAHGYSVTVSVDEIEVDDETLEPFGYNYGIGLECEARAAWQSAEAVAAEAESALSGRDVADPNAEAAIAAYLSARLGADIAGEPVREATLIVVFSDTRTGLAVRAWGPPAPVDEIDEIEGGDDETAANGAQPDEPGGVVPRRPAGPVSEAPIPVAIPAVPETDGVGNALHEVRTDVATRALIRALADDPAAAHVVLVARLFSVLVLREGVGRGSALPLHAEAYSRARTTPIATLDGDVRRRLAERRELWAASGRSSIAWVAGLDSGTRDALLAELVAMMLDLREERTTAMRRTARAEATEIAALCHADVAVHWTPDAVFLGAHPKAKLLGMLDAMGCAEPRAAACRKDELVALVAERAAERHWAPAYLSWAAEASIDDGDDPEPGAPSIANAPSCATHDPVAEDTEDGARPLAA